jgi:hypothetical protein
VKGSSHGLICGITQSYAWGAEKTHESPSRCWSLDQDFTWHSLKHKRRVISTQPCSLIPELILEVL